MKLVNGFDLMEFAKRNNFVLPAFNTTNLEMTYAIADGLMKANLPGYIQISSNNLRLSNPAIIAEIARDAVKKSETPIGLHLDHGKSFEDVKACVDAGFTSIMIDASHLPFEENVKECRRAADYCHFYGLPVEAELGKVGGQEDSVVAESMYAVPSECVEMVQKTGIDCLAPALGSVHGPYHGEPKLGFKEMDEINQIVGVPLVLHGGSGIPEDQIRKAISLGTAKINVNTECQQAWTKIVREVIANDEKVYDPRKIIGPGKKGIQAVVQAKCEIFGCINKA